MPLIIHEKRADNNELFLWRRIEVDEFFLNNQIFSQTKSEEITTWSTHRRSEWIAGRYLILKYANTTSLELQVDIYGKPYLNEGPHISISHTSGFVAIAVSARPVGIDIQSWRPNIEKIASKFCTAEELDYFPEVMSKLQRYHLIWSIKEAIYKAYGKKKVDFKKDMTLTPLICTNGVWMMECSITKGSQKHDYHVTVAIYPTFVRAWAISH